MFTVFLRTSAIFLMMAFGFALRRRGRIDDEFNRQLSFVLVSVFYPALILASIVRNFTARALLANWTLPAGVFGVMLAGWAAGLACRPLLRQRPERTRRTFHFMCAVNNYSFLPIMVVASMWGDDAVARVAFSSLGAEVFVWTIGLQALTGHRVEPAALRHLLTMPMLALAGALAVLTAQAGLHAAGFELAGRAPRAAAALGTLLNTLHVTGQATIPVSAIICGARVASIRADHVLSPLMAGLAALRLAAIPALAIVLLRAAHLAPENYRVLAVIAVQPVAMASVTMSEIYDGDAGLAAAAVLVTHVLCLVTIPLWLRAAV